MASASEPFGQERPVETPDPFEGKARLTIPEVAKYLRVSQRAVYAMLHTGVLPALRVGPRWLITTASFRRWEQNCGAPAPPNGRPH